MKAFLLGLVKTIGYFLIFIIVIIIIYFTALEMRQADILYFKTGEITGNDYIKLSPSSKWYTYNHKNWSEKNSQGYFTISRRNVKGVRYRINFTTRAGKISKDMLLREDVLLDKNGKYFNSGNKKTIFTDNEKETGITYRKNWITYVQNLKCMGSVFSRGFKGSNTNGTTKDYNIECAYYDKTVKKNDGRRTFDISSFYNYSGKDIRLQKDKNVKDDEIPTRTYVENILKEEIKNLVKTLKIKNLDVERMKKEGLMHYGKEFVSTKW